MLVKQLMFITAVLLALAAAGMGQTVQPSPAPSPEVMPMPTQSATATVQLEPKQEGVIRIGVVATKTKLKQETPGQEMAEVIRTRWYSYLDGPTIELIPIEAKLPLQANVEAAQKQCDFVLYSSVVQKAKGSLFGSFIKVAVPVLTSAVPAGVGGTTASSMTQSVRNSVQEGAKEAAKNMANQAASKIKASDQITLEFNLVAVNANATALTKTLKAKAETDGEDVISPLIEQASGLVLEVAMKKAG